MKYEYRCDIMPFVAGDSTGPPGPDGKPMPPTQKLLSQLGALGWRVVYCQRQEMQVGRVTPNTASFPALVVVMERRIDPPDVGYPRCAT